MHTNTEIKRRTYPIITDTLSLKQHRDKNVFSLPSSSAAFEHYLADNLPYAEALHIYGVERDKQRYASATEHIKVLETRHRKVRIRQECTSQFDWAPHYNSRGNKAWDLVWLDYCGGYTQDVMDTMRNLGRANIAQDGEVWVTFQMAREHANVREILNYYGSGDMDVRIERYSTRLQHDTGLYVTGLVQYNSPVPGKHIRVPMAIFRLTPKPVDRLHVDLRGNK